MIFSFDPSIKTTIEFVTSIQISTYIRVSINHRDGDCKDATDLCMASF